MLKPSKLKQEFNLTPPPQLEVLKVAAAGQKLGGSASVPRFDHVTGSIPRFANSPTTGALARAGYISLELVHSPEEIISLEIQKSSTIDEARALLNHDWKAASSKLIEASKLETHANRKAWRITERGRAVVEEVAKHE